MTDPTTTPTHSNTDNPTPVTPPNSINTPAEQDRCRRGNHIEHNEGFHRIARRELESIPREFACERDHRLQRVRQRKVREEKRSKSLGLRR
jgi:hypothetical protein